MIPRTAGVDGWTCLADDGRQVDSVMREPGQSAASWPELDELVRQLAGEAGIAPDVARQAVRDGRRVRPSLRWQLRQKRLRLVDERRELLLIAFWIALLLACVGATVFVSPLARG